MNKMIYFQSKLFIQSWISILLILLASSSNINSQQVIYKHRFGPTVMDNIKAGFESLSKGRQQIAESSVKIEQIRSDFFNAIRTDASDLDEKETNFYNALLGKDIRILFDYKLSYERFEGEPPANIMETFFGKLDGGIHPGAYIKFHIFAKAYMRHEHILTNGNLLNLDKEIFYEVMEKSQVEYESYRIVRDWIEFEKQGIQLESGEDRHKIMIIALLNAQIEDSYSFAESEIMYEKFCLLIGKNEVNLFLDKVKEDFYVNERRFGIDNSSNLIHDKDYLFSGIFRYFSKTTPELNTIYHIYAYTNCRRNISCAIEVLENAKEVFGEQAVGAVLNDIFSKDKIDKGDYDLFVEPFVINGQSLFVPGTSFISLLAKSDLNGFGDFLLKYSERDDYKTIDDLKLSGEEGFVEGMNLALGLYTKNSRNDFNSLLDIAISEIERSEFDFTGFQRLPVGNTNLGKIDYYIQGGHLPIDTIFIYTNMTDKTNPELWSTWDNTHIYDIGNGICKIYTEAPIPNVIIVKLLIEDEVKAEYAISKSDNYRIAKYSEEGKMKTVDFSKAISQYSSPCIFK